MKQTQRVSRRYLTVKQEADIDFISGFPCTNYQCTGTLQKDDYEGQMAIVCGGCEDVFYVLDAE